MTQNKAKVTATTKENKSMNINRVEIGSKIESLRASIGELEKKHGCSSGEMRDAIKAGRLAETMEVSEWLFNHRTLAKLEELSGITTVTHTKVTDRFSRSK